LGAILGCGRVDAGAIFAEIVSVRGAVAKHNAGRERVAGVMVARVQE